MVENKPKSLSLMGLNKVLESPGQTAFFALVLLEIIGMTTDIKEIPGAPMILFLGVIYFWCKCFPFAFQILFKPNRFKKFGMIGAIHITTSAIAVLFGLVVAFHSSILGLPHNPGHPALIAQGCLGIISMASSWFLFHILPKLSKKLYRRFFVGSMVTIQVALAQTFVAVWYRHHKLNKECLLSPALKYIGPIIFLLSIPTVLAAFIHCVEEIYEMVERNAPCRNTHVKLERRSSARFHGPAHNTLRAMIKTDVMRQAMGQHTSFRNLDAHEVLETDWPQLFLAGTELAFSIIYFRIGYYTSKEGGNSIDIFLRDNECESCGIDSFERAVMLIQANLAAAYFFYSGVVFPLSLVLKGSLTAEKARSLMLIYTIAISALTGIKTSVGSIFFYVIGSAFLVYFGILTPKLDLSLLCPVHTKPEEKKDLYAITQ